MTFPRETGVYPTNSRLTSAFPRLVASPPQEPGKIRCNSHNQFSRYQRKVTVPLLRRGPVIV